ncbi:EAL domain-containing protein [Celerinatantimonas diazotrophica]|uniref:Diguanylate cyclase/phosphodiesterase n=1 Tax=Celerinatantimonas diazotrophica TaxID=412034 RepID=A0A4R1KG97_9GAMM|nr:EAL domain-containing protein [Celerinatantimonas diazotrophica]TCK63207.1 diguanylate cyclase/phosphodiesterase [Celerinatantimonas diazotrophica]CAG9295576.1 RNase E specificity factor CsrD [Celerinatantimonas diazotrophica]
MKLSNKFILFIVICVVTAVGLVGIGGALTFRKLAYDQQSFKIKAIVQLLDSQLDVQPDTPEFEQWLPNWLHAHQIIRMDVSNKGGTVYTFRDVRYHGNTNLLIHYHFQLKSHPNFSITLWVESPFKRLRYAPDAMVYVFLGVIIVAVGLLISIQWLKNAFKGAERLEWRGRRIIGGHQDGVMNAEPGEWPRSASRAINQLLLQLENSRQDRARFDRMIRENAFIDELTGLANLTHFSNRLETEMLDGDANIGAVLLFQITILDEFNYIHSQEAGDVLLQQFAQLLNNYAKNNTNAIVGRVGGDQFALLLAQVTLAQAESVSLALLKQLERIPLPSGFYSDDYIAVGIAGYQFGDSPQEVMHQAEDALRVAKQQGGNAWFTVDRQLTATYIGQGSVRWRAMLEEALSLGKVCYFEQLIYARNRIPYSVELLARIQDSDSTWLTASVFWPWVERCGMVKQFDYLAIENALERLKTSTISVNINLDVETLQEKAVIRRLIYWAMETNPRQAGRLIIELKEQQVAFLGRRQQARINALREKGILIAIDRAGQNVLSTQYINDLQPAYIKLHPSLVRDLARRQVNRLAISSLLASAEGKAKVVAVGVESDRDWQVLERLGVNAGQGNWFSPVIAPEKED